MNIFTRPRYCTILYTLHSHRYCLYLSSMACWQTMINDEQNQRDSCSASLFFYCFTSLALLFAWHKKLSFVGWLKRSHLLHLIKILWRGRGRTRARGKNKQDLLVSGITLTSSNDGSTQQMFKLRSSTRIHDIF